MRRVPEVIDVWFDAGCMPFAQWGYPHAPGSQERFDRHFPADFISEAIDQTRGWFYALLASSTLLFEGKRPYPHPFKNCVCLGLLLGEDGQKLSKRLRNYSPPTDLIKKYGADALRWSLLSKNPPTATTRFAAASVEESQREYLIRWYNVYSFFLIYAEVDGFDPRSAPAGVTRELVGNPAGDENGSRAAGSRSGGGRAGGQPPWRAGYQRAELDRWVLSELAAASLAVRRHMDQYDCYSAARALTGLLDGLSNWYVRRSRSRFWGAGWSQDKADAFWTLYECLVTFARLSAPFTPFFSESVWQNLVRKPLPAGPESVHLSDLPRPDESLIDRTLLEEMALVRQVVRLGLSARQSTNVKVRQPLPVLEVIVANPANRPRIEKHVDLVTAELNVKRVDFPPRPEEYVSYEIKPNFKSLGPRFGKTLGAVQKAIQSAPAASMYAQLSSGAAVRLTLADGQTVELTQQDVDVRLSVRPGFSVASSPGLVVVLSNEITPDLRAEGWVREFVHHVQGMRKELQLPYQAQIHLTVTTPESELESAFGRFSDYITGELLANRFEVKSNGSSANEENSGGAFAKVVVVDGHEIRATIRKSS
jgi:isoleucyl-tRNA synthetase